MGIKWSNSNSLTCTNLRILPSKYWMLRGLFAESACFWGVKHKQGKLGGFMKDHNMADLALEWENFYLPRKKKNKFTRTIISETL